jgi:serine/threonine protein kinase
VKLQNLEDTTPCAPPNVSASAASAQRRIGDYRILRELGHGAMSIVYEAEHVETGEIVALKLLAVEPEHDRDSLGRMQREIAALQKVAHPCVARLLGSGSDESGRPYLVFERVDGPTLKDLIRRGRPLDPIQAMDWMIQAAEALAEAWKRHIIHRDIKPGNMMVDESGRLKLLDFGLAKAIFEDLSITQEREQLGTPLYMSPEMALNRSLDYRADIYSLGATFYHLLTGRPAFAANSPIATLMMHANAPLVSPRLLEPDLPEDLCEIIERMMAKAPEDRPATHHELIAELRDARLACKARVASHPRRSPPPDALEAIASAESHGPIAEPRDRRRLLVVGALAVAVVAALAFNFWALGSAGRSAPSTGWVARGLSSAPAPAESIGASPAALDAETQSRMRELMSTLLSQRSRLATPSLGALVRSGAIERERARDAWGRPFDFDPARFEIHSLGADGRPRTGDDHLLNAEMKFVRAPRP